MDKGSPCLQVTDEQTGVNRNETPAAQKMEDYLVLLCRSGAPLGKPLGLREYHVPGGYLQR